MIRKCVSCGISLEQRPNEASRHFKNRQTCLSRDCLANVRVYNRIGRLPEPPKLTRKQREAAAREAMDKVGS
jgi:hypothetical protein